MSIIWCAELGSMHKGDKSLAFELIRQAAQAGATICKFQFGWNKETQEKFGLEFKELRYIDPVADDLEKWCRYFGVELMASVWSISGVDTLKRHTHRCKVAHQVSGDAELMSYVSQQFSELFISNPVVSTIPEDTFYHPIYCSDQYPCYPNQLKIPPYFSHWRKYGYEGKVSTYEGYSDHTHGIDACLLAVSRGAMYIEKHFCLDKSDLTVRDTPFSTTPDEFAEMVRIGNGMRRLLDAGV